MILKLIKKNNNKKTFNTYKVINKSDKAKIIINVFLYYGLRVFILSYGIIRIFLINIYLGVTNFGLLNVMMLISPLSLFFISACQDKSNFILYKYSLTNDYQMINKLINEQIKEMHYYTFFSLFIVGFIMIISYFFVNSPGLNHLTACLLILGNSIGMLSFGIVLPYVQWYLNSLHYNYVYDIWEIFFSTFLNILSFILIILFGIHKFNFYGVNYEQGSTYIILIVTFLLSSRICLANIILTLLKKKYMPWFKRQKVKSWKIFNKNSTSYLIQDFFSAIAVTMVPVTFFILTIFIHLGTALSGIYYSYVTFVLIISLLGWGITAVKPYFAKYIINNSKEKVYQLNKLISYIFIYLGLILLVNFIIASPYIMVFMKSYFNFWLPFLIGACYLIFVVKLVEEAFIYLDGHPERYWRLTVYEIIVGVICMIISLVVVLFNPSFETNAINVIYAVTVSELIMRFAKYVFNIVYLNKYVYHKKIINFLRDYWLIYLSTISIVIIIICVLSLSNYIKQEEIKFTTGALLNVWSSDSISIIFIDNIHYINYANVFISLIFMNLFASLSITISLIYSQQKLSNNVKMFIQNIKKQIIFNHKWKKF